MSHRALLRYCGNQTEGTVRNTYICKWREKHIQKWQMGGRRKWRLGGRLSMAARWDMGGCKFMKLGLGLPDTWSNPIKHHFWRFEHKFCRWSASKWNYHGIDTLEPQPTSKSGLGNLARLSHAIQFIINILVFVSSLTSILTTNISKWLSILWSGDSHGCSLIHCPQHILQVRINHSKHCCPFLHAVIVILINPFHIGTIALPYATSTVGWNFPRMK